MYNFFQNIHLSEKDNNMTLPCVLFNQVITKFTRKLFSLLERALIFTHVLCF